PARSRPTRVRGPGPRHEGAGNAPRHLRLRPAGLGTAPVGTRRRGTRRHGARARPRHRRPPAPAPRRRDRTMSDLQAFLTLGFRHIPDLAAMDHILFLLALAAIYRARDWRRSLWVISAFTAGHSVTLALAVTGAVVLPTALIEFLIPLTIVATCIENLLVADRARAWWGGRYRPVFAGVFGLVHGAGFANYLRSLFVAPIALPLFGFNVGIELGQLVVLALAAGALGLLDRGIAALPRAPAVSHLRFRVVAVSAFVALVAARWAVARSPW